jgi:starch-binding outer membrane protein, SusD/RagB family
MTKHTMSRSRLALSLATLSLAALAGCSLDVTNPNAATQESVLTTPTGLRTLGVGLQGRLGNFIGPSVTLSGVVSGELGNTNASLSTTREFQRYPDASANSAAIDPTNPDLLSFWSTGFQVVRAANDILDNVNSVNLAAGTRSGLSALARTAKAFAYGQMIEAWPQLPLDLSASPPGYRPRAEVLTEVRALLAAARTDLATPVSTEFTSSVLQASIDLPNTIRALQARYSLAAGDYNAALTFANEVPAAATSRYTYSTVDPNPIWQSAIANGYFAAISTYRTDAEAGDTRVNRNTQPTQLTPTPFGGANLFPLNIHRASTDPYALFSQDELSLIRAEAYARTNRLPEAIAQINVVRANAGLGPQTSVTLPTQAAVLDEIYRQRRYALFLTGTRWADERRFGRLTEARAAWLPYPAQETVSNPNPPSAP